MSSPRLRRFHFWFILILYSSDFNLLFTTVVFTAYALILACLGDIDMYHTDIISDHVKSKRKLEFVCGLHITVSKRQSLGTLLCSNLVLVFEFLMHALTFKRHFKPKALNKPKKNSSL